MKCFMCEWTGHPDELIAITDEPETINDFVYCPDCQSNVWDIDEGNSNLPVSRFKLIEKGICPDCKGNLDHNGYCADCHIVPALDPDFQKWIVSK